MNKSFSKYKKASWYSIALSDPAKERNFKTNFLKFSRLDPDIYKDWLDSVSRHQGIKWHKLKICTLTTMILKGNGE
jgi:hypothetical protein